MGGEEGGFYLFHVFQLCVETSDHNLVASGRELGRVWAVAVVLERERSESSLKS